MQQCNPPCPPHLCEQWWHHGMCALDERCPICGKKECRGHSPGNGDRRDGSNRTTAGEISDG